MRTYIYLIAVAITFAVLNPPSWAGGALSVELFHEGPVDQNSPSMFTAMAAAPDATGRLFITQLGGRIDVLVNGVPEPTPALDISARFTNFLEPPTMFTEGFYGLALHPDFLNNGHLYVHYTDLQGGSVGNIISRFTMLGDPATSTTIDPASEEILLSVPISDTSQHHGGQIAFSPNDGMLYITYGDGQFGGASPIDPDNVGQRLDSLKGKVLRIDVDGDDPYGIPPDNPFVSEPGARGEIWARGLRNPATLCFDAFTGDLYIGDVGEDDWEEINYQPAGSPGGQNYGWRLFEGPDCTTALGGPDQSECDTRASEVTFPFFLLDHASNESPAGVSVLCGYPYRGTALGQDFQGRLFFADFGSMKVWTLRNDNGSPTDLQEHTADINPQGDFFTGFGHDLDNEIYLFTTQMPSLTGQVYKIVPANPPPADAVAIDGPASVQEGGQVELQAQVNVPLSGNVTYTWTKNGRPIPGATEANLVFSNVALDDAGQYRVRVTDESKALFASDPFVLSVDPAKPMNATGGTALAALCVLLLSAGLMSFGPRTAGRGKPVR